jgi:hypothetical protein
MAKKWIQGAIKHPGALTRQAKAAGKTVQQFCAESHTGVTAKRCNLAKTLSNMRKGS